MNFRVIILALFCQVAWLNQATCQGGFKKILPFVENSKFVINDIQYKSDHLFLHGSIYIDSLNLWGGFIAICDTFGNINKSLVFFDPDRLSNLSDIGSCEISVLSESHIAVPIHFFNYHQPGLCIINLFDNSFKIIKYNYNGIAIFPKQVITMYNKIYLLGYVQRENLSIDNFIIKTDLSGEFIWIKYYGSINYDEYPGDAIVINGCQLMVSSCVTNEEFLINLLTGWKKPWIFTIDTSGVILKSWIGEQNDERTLGGGPISPIRDENILIVSREYQEIIHHGAEIIAANPIITSLNQNYTQEWKHYLGNFNSPLNEIFDLAYDSLRNEAVLAGQKVVIYDEEQPSILEMWFIKVSQSGEIKKMVRSSTISEGRE